MRAAVITAFGDANVLSIEDRPKPSPSKNEILVRVRASALNRADVLQRQGNYPPPPDFPPDIPGLEFAGEIAELGRNATHWKIGQRVFGITGGGAHAEFIPADQNTVSEIPPNLTWEQAAAVPEAFITAHDALWTQAKLQPGETVLIHAVGSGVGIAAVQLARAKGAVPFGTSRTQSKLEAAEHFGLDKGLLTGSDPGTLKDFAKEVTGGKGFDVCLDLVGGAYVGATIPAMAPRGRILLLATVAGTKAEIPLGLTLVKRLTLIGTVLRSRSLEEKVLVNKRFEAEVLPLLANGTLKPVVEMVFPLDRVREAHELLESNRTFGKIVLTI